VGRSGSADGAAKDTLSVGHRTDRSAQYIIAIFRREVAGAVSAPERHSGRRVWPGQTGCPAAEA
jgi:hypothetical protein